MINLDNVGGPGSITLTGSDDAIADVAETAEELGIAVTSSPAPAPGITRSDHIPFIERGTPAVWITTPPYPLLHTPQDTIDRIDAGILASVSALVTAYLEEAAAKPCA
jgi:Zn-dependent M28 family amino/carboxypeptidase